MWLMKTLLTSRCINQRGAGYGGDYVQIKNISLLLHNETQHKLCYKAI